MKFNSKKFIEQAKNIYGADVIDKCQRLNSKELLHKSVKYADCEYPFFAYKCPKIEKALYSICENEIGDLVIKLIHKNMCFDFRPLGIWNNDDKFKNIDFKKFGRKIEVDENCNEKKETIIVLIRMVLLCT